MPQPSLHAMVCGPAPSENVIVSRFPSLEMTARCGIRRTFPPPAVERSASGIGSALQVTPASVDVNTFSKVLFEVEPARRNPAESTLEDFGANVTKEKPEPFQVVS